MVWIGSPRPALAPDLSGDSLIDCDDLAIFSQTFGSTNGAPAYLPAADLVPDGRIDGKDLTRFLTDFPTNLNCLAVLDPERFVPLDSDGRPVEGALVQAAVDGTLPPLDYRPGGPSLLGIREGLTIRMAAGAWLVAQDGEVKVAFDRAQAFFGADSPIRFTTSLEKNGGLPVVLALDGVEVADLALAFGFEPVWGLPVRLFDRFDMDWRDGRLTDAGIEGARFALHIPDLPLPDQSAPYPGFRMDLTQTGEIRIPFYGECALPDGSGALPRMFVSPMEPMWLTLRVDGSVAMGGRVDLEFPDGPRVRADVRMDDPFYRLQLFSDSIHIPALDSLADLLPASPASCIPIEVGEAQLDQASQCLLSHAEAYRLFSASAAAAAPYDINTLAAAPAPPDSVDLAAAVLDAWAYSGLAPLVQALPLEELQDLLAQVGKSAAASGDLDGIARYHLALTRLRQAVQSGGIDGSPEAQARMAEAVEAVVAAAVARAQEPDALNSLESTVAAIRLLLQAAQIRQMLGVSDDAELFQASIRMLNLYAQGYIESLGIVAGVYVPPSRSPIADMNRYVAVQNLHDILEISAGLQLMGASEEQITALFPEAIGQLAWRLYETTDAAVDQAEATLDYRAFAFALGQMLDVMALVQSGIVPDVPELAVLPSLDDLPAYTGRMDALFEFEQGKPWGDWQLRRHARELEWLLDFLREMPAAVTFSPNFFQRTYDRMEQALDRAVATLFAQDDLDELLTILQAGILHRELGERFAFAMPVDWVAERLPPVIARLKLKATEQRGWSELYRGARLLMNEADRRDLEGDQATRKVYLEKAASLLEAAHEVAVALWNAEETRRGNLDPALRAADMLLPGDIDLEGLGGSIAYHRETGFLAGSFEGTLRLPKFDLSLTVDRASITSGGTFDIAAHGAVGVPAGDPSVVLSIPERRPIQVHYTPGYGVRFAGSARAAFDNGVSFESYWRLEDPIYEFGLTAEGLRLELANELTLLMPDIDEEAGEVFTTSMSKDLNAYYRSLCGAMEGLLPLTELPVVDTRQIGEPPEFEAPAVTLEFDALEAWANCTASNVFPRVNGAYSNSLEQIHATLEALTAEAESVADALGEERRSWEYEVMFVGALRLVRFALERIEAQAVPAPPGFAAKGVAAAGAGQEIGLPETREQLIAAVLAKREALRASIARLPARNLNEAIAQARALTALCAEESALDLQVVIEDIEVSAQILHQGRVLEYQRMGLDPATGEIVDEAKFNGLTLDDLLRGRIRAAAIEADTEALGGGDSTWSVAVENVTRRRTAIMYEKLANAKTDNERIEWSLRIFHEGVEHQAYGVVEERNVAEEGFRTYVETLEGPAQRCKAAGIDYRDPNCKRFREGKKFADEVNKQIIEEKNRIIDDTVGRMKRVRPFVPPNPPPDAAHEPEPDERGWLEKLLDWLHDFDIDLDIDFGALLDDLVKVELGEIGVRIDVIGGSVAGTSLTTTEELLRQLVDLGAWIQERMPEDQALIDEWKLDLDNLTHEFTTVAEAKKAWWRLGRYTELLNQAAERYRQRSNQALVQSLDEAATASILASKHIAEDFAALLAAVHLDEVRMALPGDLVVERAFGSVYYDRSIPYLRGTFGGRVAFPDVDAVFAVREATLASDGSFGIDAFTSTPLPLDGIRLEADLDIAGDAFGLDHVTGSGTLFFDTGETFSVSAGYEEAFHRLYFNTLAQNLDLRFTDDFVLFDAGFGLELSTVSPAGTLSALGSAGLFARAPLPETGLTPSHFQLAAEGASASFHYGIDSVALSLGSGTLHLPDLFTLGLCEGGTPVTNGPHVVLSPSTPIEVLYTNNPEAVSFAGSVAFDNLGFELPGLTGFAVEVCTATLDFDGSGLPVLSNVYGELAIPLPTDTVRVDIVKAAWDLEGIPFGTITLTSNATLYSQGGFEFTLLGQNPNGCDFSGLSASNRNDGTCSVRVGGGIEVAFPADVLSDEIGGSVAGRACGNITFNPGEPALLDFESFAIGPIDVRLGGADGLLVTNAIIESQNPNNFFHQSTNTPFILTLSGGFSIPGGPSFGMTGAKFTFDNPGQPPKFSVESISIGLDGLELIDNLNISISEARLTFVTPDLPLPWLVAPTNLEVGLSASAVIGIEPVQIAGIIDDLRARLDANGDLKVSADGLGMGVGPLPLGPLLLDGTVYIAGLNNPPNWYFAGRVGGQIVGSDIGVMAIVAFNHEGPLGVCLDVNAGPAGIPLGQTTLLLTGAQGGLSFFGKTQDPCDITSWIHIGDDGRPVEDAGLAAEIKAVAPRAIATWEELAEYQRAYELEQQAAKAGPPAKALLPKQAAAEEPGIPCPTGDCPPATVGILCQPHPDTERYPDRVIFKFTSISEDFLNTIGVGPDFFNGMNDANQIANQVASMVGTAITNVIRPPDPVLLTNGFDEVYAFYTNVLHEFQVGISNVMFEVVAGALGSPTQTVYQAVVEAAYAGVPCPKITLKVQATLSQALVSTFLSMDAGVILGTDITGQFVDSAGVVGAVNLVGVPVGHAKAFVSYMDSSGNPNPSLCGEVEAALGPISMGNLAFSFECPDCVTGLLGSMGELFLCVGGEVVDLIVSKVAPDLLGLPFEDLALNMSDDQKMAFLAELFGVANPPPGFYDNLASCVFAAVSNSWDSIRPQIALCGAAQTKLFGIPMGAQLASVAVAATKTNLNAYLTCSPSYMLLAASTMNMFPPQLAYDEASLGVGLSFPDTGAFLLGGLSGRFQSPDALGAYLEEGFARFMEDATFTIGYAFTPFGLRMAEAQARVIMPNLTDPPAFRDPDWQRPEDRGFPKRLDLVLGAMHEELFDKPYWKGGEADLCLAFPEGSAERGIIQSNHLSFARDYFPHGGLVGGARITLPPALTEAPPPVFFTMLDPTADILERLGAAFEYVDNYVMSFTSVVGSLVFYIPAPNPPSLTNDQGRVLTPIDLMDSIRNFDMDNIHVGSLYPIEASFFRGYLDGKLIGVPIATASIEAYPAGAGEDAYFQITAGIPTGSWLQEFVDSANLLFEVRQCPPRPIEERFGELLPILDDVVNNPATTNDPNSVLTAAYNSIADDLPKVALSVTITNLHMPDALTNLLASASATTEFYAFSPRYDPSCIGTSPVSRARRDGGIALRGNFDFADLMQIDNAELAVSPRPTGLPALSGLFNASNLVLVGGSPGWGFHDIALEFNSEPGPGEPYLRGEGDADAIDIGLLSVVPIGGGDRLHGLIEVASAAGGPPVLNMEMDAAQVSCPVLGTSMVVRIHGTNSVEAPFNFSTRDPWSAAVTASGVLELKDLGGKTVLTIGGNRDFNAVFSGVGFANGTMRLSIPGGVTATAFPGTLYAQQVTIGLPGTWVDLFIASDGTFQLDATVQPMSFGVFRVSSLTGSNLSLQVKNSGLSVPGGARLAVQGVADDLLTLNAFDLRTDGTFNMGVASGAFAISNYFALSSGSMSLVRDAGQIVTFRMEGQSMTVFTGTTFQTHFPSLVDSLVVASDGRFACTAGVKTVGLPGLFSARGTLDFGYNPDPNQPSSSVSPPSINFGIVDENRSTSRLVTVQNTGQLAFDVTATSSRSMAFPVSPYSLSVPPGSNKAFAVGFMPQGSGTYTGQVTLRSSAFLSPVDVSVAGEARALPVFYASRSAIAFPERRVGAQVSRSLVIGNIGSTNLQVTSLPITGPFSISPAPIMPISLAPGARRALTVVFQPVATTGNTGTLTFVTSGAGTHEVALSGSGSNSRWRKQKEPRPWQGDISDLAILSAEMAWGAGDDGLFETDSGGRGWRQRAELGAGLRTVTFEPAATGTLMQLFFEEPGGSTRFADSSGRTNTAVGVGSACPLAAVDGKRGYGVQFDGANDCLDAPVFDIDDNFTISLWVNPARTNVSQALVGKHDAGADNQILMGLYFGAYSFRIRTVEYHAGVPSMYWQHLAVVGQKTGTNTTHVAFWQDGKVLWEQDFNTVVGDVGNGYGWTIGQDWDLAGSTPVRSDFFAGVMDEVTIVNRALSGTELAALASKPPRGVAAGVSGRAFQTRDGGLTWKRLEDSRVSSSVGSWQGSAFSPERRLALAGSFGGSPAILIETNDLQFASVISGYGSGTLRDIVFGPTFGVAVGDNGLILRTTNGGLSWAQSTSGVPATNFYGCAADPRGFASATVVGAGGTVLFSSDAGYSWRSFWLPVNTNITQDLYDIDWSSGSHAFVCGGEGSMLDIYATRIPEAVPDAPDLYAVGACGDAGAEQLWAAGAQGGLLCRGTNVPSVPVAMVSSEELDFGTVAPGAARSMLLNVQNFGQSDLVITGFTLSLGPFAVNQSGSLLIPPEHSADIRVVYRPTATATLHTAGLTLACNDPEGPLRVALKGCAESIAWQGYAVASNPVVAISFPGSNVGFAATANAVYKSQDGGVSWTQLSAAPPGGADYRALFFTDTTNGWVGGKGVIARTANGGATWSNQLTGFSQAVEDLQMLDASGGMAVRGATSMLEGDVLTTASGGSSWSSFTYPSGFDGTCGFPFYGAFCAASGRNLYGFDGGWMTWLAFPSGQEIKETTFKSFVSYPPWGGSVNTLRGWTVGSGGTLRIYEDLSGGVSLEGWGEPYDNTVFNGTPLSDVSFGDVAAGWVVGVDSIWHSEDAGRKWALEFADTDSAVGCVYARSAGEAWAGGSSAGAGVVWKRVPAAVPAKGILVTHATRVWSEVAYGTNANQSVEIKNVGTNTVNISRIAIEEDEGLGLFSQLDPRPPTLAAGASTLIRVRYTATSPGEHRAIFTVASDAHEGLLRTELIGRTASVTSHVVTIATEPPGLPVWVDGTPWLTPVAFSVGDDAAADPWESGSSHTVSAPMTAADAVGAVLDFHRWSPSASANFTLTASRSTPSYTAYYLPAGPPAPPGLLAAEAAEPGKAAAAAAGGPPSGPYLRLSGAQLAVPVLGNFQAQGEMLLSAQAFHAALTTGAVRIPSNTVNLLEVGSGAWEVDYVAGSHLRLSSQTPRVYVLGKRTDIGSALELFFESNGHFSASLSTFQDIQILPGVLEFGPGSVALNKAVFYTLDLSGSARLLKGPDGWAVQQALNLHASDGPFAWTIPGLPNPLVRLPSAVGGLDFLEFRDGSASIRRDAEGVFSLSLDDYDLYLLEQALLTDMDASADTSGILAASGTVPPRRIDLLPSAFYLMTSGTYSMVWNTFAPSVRLTLPDITLYDNGLDQWTDGLQITSGFTFDSEGDFDTGKIGLPAFTFDGITLSAGGDSENNYVRVQRESGVLAVSIRDRRDFFGAEMDLGFDFDTGGNVNGWFKGDLTFDFKVGELDLKDIPLLGMEMIYGGGAVCQFEGTGYALGFTWAVCFGEDCGGICTDITIGVCPACYTKRLCLGTTCQ